MKEDNYACLMVLTHSARSPQIRYVPREKTRRRPIKIHFRMIFALWESRILKSSFTSIKKIYDRKYKTEVLEIFFPVEKNDDTEFGNNTHTTIVTIKIQRTDESGRLLKHFLGHFLMKDLI